jgi:PST family polysaccharide transporter
VAGYIFLPRRKDRVLAVVGIASGLINLVAALILAPLFGAIGIALARVIGEAILSVLLVGTVIRLELVGLVPGGQRAIGMVRVACGLWPHARAGKDE